MALIRKCFSPAGVLVFMVTLLMVLAVCSHSQTPISEDRIQGLTPVGQSINALLVTGTNSLVYVDSTGAAQMMPCTAVAISGSYTNLLNQPSIPSAQVNSDWNSVSGVSQILNKPTIPIIVTPTINNSVSRSLVTTTASTGFQISSTRQAIGRYSVSTSTTATIGGASNATVFLEVAPTNSVTPSDWVTVCKVSNQQTITLAIVLQSIQVNELQLTGTIPAGYYVRIRYTVTGTSSVSYDLGQETIL